MPSIVIYRKELTTYSVIVDVSQEKADQLLNEPKKHRDELDQLCRATNGNWMDADDAEFEVKENDLD